MEKLEKGYVHVYTGNGKGKTTAAVGLLVRSGLAGFNVYMGQFIKGMEYNEVKIQKFLENVKIEQYGQDCFIEKEPTEEDVKRAKAGLEKISKILEEGNYDLVILDELTIGLFYKLFTVEDVIEILDRRKENVEVVITGRYAPEELINYADLVTEMKEIKHYYNTLGIEAREGIER